MLVLKNVLFCVSQVLVLVQFLRTWVGLVCIECEVLVTTSMHISCIMKLRVTFCVKNSSVSMDTCLVNKNVGTFGLQHTKTPPRTAGL